MYQADCGCLWADIVTGEEGRERPAGPQGDEAHPDGAQNELEAQGRGGGRSGQAVLPRAGPSGPVPQGQEGHEPHDGKIRLDKEGHVQGEAEGHLELG